MKKYNYFAYGSLISHKSLQKTILDKKFTPALIKGYKRIFNLIAKKSRYPDVLNLQESKNSRCNGVLFKINEKELRKLKIRETEYDVKETTAYDFLSKKKLCKCITVIDHYISIDNFGKKPNKKYFILCREAAYSISKNFGKYWDNSTYTSSGEKILNWIKNNKAFNTINQ